MLQPHTKQESHKKHHPKSPKSPKSQKPQKLSQIKNDKEKSNFKIPSVSKIKQKYIQSAESTHTKSQKHEKKHHHRTKKKSKKHNHHKSPKKKFYWICDLCTYHNHLQVRFCEMCGCEDPHGREKKK